MLARLNHLRGDNVVNVVLGDDAKRPLSLLDNVKLFFIRIVLIFSLKIQSLFAPSLNVKLHQASDGQNPAQSACIPTTNSKRQDDAQLHPRFPPYRQILIIDNF